MDQKYKSDLANMATIDTETIVEIAEMQGKAFKEAKIKTNQIRNFYAEVNTMKLKFQEFMRNKKKEKLNGQGAGATSNLKTLEDLNRKLILLKPKLAYAGGRQIEVKQVYTFFKHVIDGVSEASKDKDEDTWIKALENFFDLTESVVAYHKYHGDK